MAAHLNNHGFGHAQTDCDLPHIQPTIVNGVQFVLDLKDVKQWEGIWIESPLFYVSKRTVNRNTAMKT